LKTPTGDLLLRNDPFTPRNLIKKQIKRFQDLLMNLSPMGNSLVPMSGPLTPPSPVMTPLRQRSPPPPTLEELLMTPSAPPACPSPQGNQVPLSSSSNTLYYERQYMSPLIEAARAQNGYGTSLHRGTSLGAGKST